MALASLQTVQADPTGPLLLSRVAERGTRSHVYPRQGVLLTGPDSARNLADMVHCLAALHGRSPGLLDHAANRHLDPQARDWFAAALEGFAAERAFLARLAVTVGPIPGTPGARHSEAALAGQRHAFETLAQSERTGCALGAAMALVADWAAIRPVLDTAARHFGFAPPACRLTDLDALVALADAACVAQPTIPRAMLFGAEQVALHHYGLWDLLEARQEARAKS